jgi:uncharacterized protein
MGHSESYAGALRDKKRRGPPLKTTILGHDIFSTMQGFGMTMRRTAAVSIASSLGAGLLALVLPSPYSTARAASADAVLCDRVAAEPSDPDKPADVKGVVAIAPSDVPIAIKYCRLASGGSRRALFELGRAYAANQQLADAISAYRKAADKGSSAAMVELGVLFAAGSGVAKDPDQARTLFQRAAAAGNPRGATELTALSSAGGAPSDPVEQRAMLARAAETNSADAEFQLGWMMANGIGGPQDDMTARTLFEKAAAQNHPEALDWMGSFSETGRGGPKDKDAAKSYYQRAAALGNEDAKTALKRLDCPFSVRDKRGKIVSYVCF